MPSESEVVHDLAAGVPVPRTPARPEASLLTGKLVPPEVAPATVVRGPADDRAHPRRPAERRHPAERSRGVGQDDARRRRWLHAQPGGSPIGWITLDAYDDDPATFWTYVLEALDGAGVDIDRVSRPVPGEAVHPSVIPGLALAVLAHPRSRPVVLVIDQADYLSNPLIMTGLDLLLRNAGHRLHLVLCGRADPGLPLHKYRLDGSMAEIRSAQLAFTPEETRELFHAAGVRVSAPVAQALCEQAEGWAVGLRLAVAPLKQGIDPEQLVDLARPRRRQRGPVPLRGGARGPAGLGAPVPSADQRHRGPGARAGQPVVGSPQRRPHPRRSGAGERLRRAVTRCAGRVPDPSALPGDAAGAAGLHRAARARPPASRWRRPGTRRPGTRSTGSGTRSPPRTGASRRASWSTRCWSAGCWRGRRSSRCRASTAYRANLPGAEAAVVRAATAISARHAPTPADLATVAAASFDPANRLPLRAAAALTYVAARRRTGRRHRPAPAPRSTPPRRWSRLCRPTRRRPRSSAGGARRGRALRGGADGGDRVDPARRGRGQRVRRLPPAQRHRPRRPRAARGLRRPAEPGRAVRRRGGERRRDARRRRARPLGDGGRGAGVGGPGPVGGRCRP